MGLSSGLPALSFHSVECASGTLSSDIVDGDNRRTFCWKGTKNIMFSFPKFLKINTVNFFSESKPNTSKRSYTGPLIISAIMTFMSAMYSCRSGYGRSNSVLLCGTMNSLFILSAHKKCELTQITHACASSCHYSLTSP